MNGAFQVAASMLARWVTARFKDKTRRTSAVQRAFLLKLLRQQQNTAFGRQHGLDRIRTVEQFRARLPIRGYEYYRPYAERVARGEPKVLTAAPVDCLNISSGSTGRQKFIPVTPQARRARGKAHLTGICFGILAAQQQQRSIGQVLMPGPIQLAGYTAAGIPYAPVSVGDLRSKNWLYRQLFAHPYEALQPSNSLARHYACLLFALKNRNTRIIAATFPVLALRICQYLEDYAESLIADLARGTIAAWVPLEAGLRKRLERRLSPAPQRAQQLQQVVERNGRLTPIAAWPNLAFVVTARGGTSDFYLQKFTQYFGYTPVFGGIYSSNEAVFGICPNFDDDSAILAIESGFYEFVPPQEWNKQQPETLLAEQVIIGEQYRILVTNYNGFYRYDIGDIVEVVGFYGNAPTIVFRYRWGGTLSSTTEKTTETHVVRTIQRLQREFNLTLENFCITLAEHQIPPPYILNIELASGASLDNPQAFLQRFDNELKAIHDFYAIKRQSQIPPPQLRILAPGSFAQVRERMYQNGIPENHVKVPHISEDSNLLADLQIKQECAFASS